MSGQAQDSAERNDGSAEQNEQNDVLAEKELALEEEAGLGEISANDIPGAGAEMDIHQENEGGIGIPVANGSKSSVIDERKQEEPEDEILAPPEEKLEEDLGLEMEKVRNSRARAVCA